MRVFAQMRSKEYRKVPMMKERYETPELEIVEFNDEEILTDGDDYVLPSGVLPTTNSLRNHF